MDPYLCFFCCFSFVSCSIIVLFFLLCSVKGGSQSSTNLPSKSNYSHHLPGGMNYITNIIMQNLIQRLRSLVGLKGWDFCVLWKQSEDQRFIKWMDCCCSGTETTQINGTGQDLVFPVTPVLPCRDTMLQHPRTRSCDLLAKMPSSMPLDSGIYAQTLISNQPSWLNFSNNTCLSTLEEDVGTRVLIPIPGGLIELLVAKQVLEDQQVIDFITAQYNISLEQGALINTMSEIQSQRGLFEDGNHDQMDPNNHFQQPPTNSLENLNLPYDHHHHHVSMGRIFPSSNSHPINFVQQFTYNLGNKVKINNNVAFEDSSHDNKPFLSDKQMDYPFNFSADHQIGFQEMEAMQRSMMSGDHQTQHMHMQYMEPLEPDDMDQQEGNYEKDTNLHEVRQADLVSDCSDQIDGEEDAKCRRRTGKGPQAKNLVAERNRRKKLNARLYNLRSLVPIISKLDRASILGDAIEYVQELQKQAKQLQDELDDHAEDEGAKKSGITCHHNNKTQSKIQSQSGLDDLIVPKTDQHHEDHNKASNGFHLRTPGDGSPDSDVIHDHKTQQMEPQVEVAQLDGNQFYVKVFCEHKFGGFGKLMEALSSLSLEVTNANVTSFTCLVSNVFIVEKKDSGIVEADEVRDSLLELTRNPTRWRSSDMAKAAENGVRLNNHHDHHLHNHHFDPFHLQHLPNEA